MYEENKQQIKRKSDSMGSKRALWVSPAPAEIEHLKYCHTDWYLTGYGVKEI